jgi:hypothetical protein
VHGVDGHSKPLLVETLAPGGVDSTVKSWAVPRVIVAQPLTNTAAAAVANRVLIIRLPLERFSHAPLPFLEQPSYRIQ